MDFTKYNMIEERGRKNNKILIFLALGILFVLIIGIIIWSLSTEPKPDPLSLQCQNACEGNSVYGFCSAERKVNNELKITCQTLAEDSQYVKYGVETCPEISCEPQDLDQTCVIGLGGTWESPTAEGGCSQGGAKVRRQVTSPDEPPVEGQICCG